MNCCLIILLVTLLSSGASRWEDHLDDMPTAGWGYGALVNNQTSDFLELLYGHMASYQSRGTFHSTEQLSFLGTGRYRSFLHIKDPPVDLASPIHEVTSQDRAQSGYYGIENDVSFCIVSNILVARMTRWQLVMEDSVTNSIWLARCVTDSINCSLGSANLIRQRGSEALVCHQCRLQCHKCSYERRVVIVSC